MADGFAARCRRAMRAVARESGHFSAYPDTPHGRRAALQQQLRLMDAEGWFCSDFQRSLVLTEV